MNSKHIITHSDALKATSAVAAALCSGLYLYPLHCSSFKHRRATTKQSALTFSHQIDICKQQLGIFEALSLCRIDLFGQ